MARVLIGNFKGPKGDDGAQGPVGPAGPEGKQGPVGPAGGVNSVNTKQGDLVFNPVNLARGTSDYVIGKGWPTGTVSFSYDGGQIVDIPDCPDPHIKKGARLAVQADKNNCMVRQVATPFVKGEIYTVGLYARTEKWTETLDLLITFGSNRSKRFDMPNDNIWHYYTATIDTTGADTNWFSIGAEDIGSGTGEITICGVMAARGTTPVDWSPAPEDYLGPVNIYNIPNMHRNIFRGQNLGDTFTDEQKAAIAAGTFEGLYLGDYWTMNERIWRIADFDYWLGKGDGAMVCTKHHIVVVPDMPLYTAKMNDSRTTEGGYYNSDMRTTRLAKAKEMIGTDFGVGSILNHRVLLTNAVKDGYPSAGAMYDSEVELMNEMMVYGAFHYAPRGTGITIPYNSTMEYTQLALFQSVPYYIMPNRQYYWLRDVVSADTFAYVSGIGCSSQTQPNASLATYGIRPAVGIVGD